jgi:hypothetical protein
VGDARPGATAVGGPSAMQHVHGMVALALGRMRDSAGGPTMLGLWQWAGHSSNVSIFFSNTSTTPNLKNTKVVPHVLQIFPNFTRWYIISKGTTLLLERSSDCKRNLN